MDVTSAVVDAFRTDFEGFADDTVWTDAKVTRALQHADKETGGSGWGAYSDLSTKQLGMFNYAAHYLSIKKSNAKATSAGGTPGSTSQVQSKSVGDESVTYAVNPQSTVSGDEALKSTDYGQEFIRLRRSVGRGGSSSNARVA